MYYLIKQSLVMSGLVLIVGRGTASLDPEPIVASIDSQSDSLDHQSRAILLLVGSPADMATDDHLCLQSVPPGNCTCTPWEEAGVNHKFKDGTPSGSCCANPRVDPVCNHGWCYCREGGWQPCFIPNGGDSRSTRGLAVGPVVGVAARAAAPHISRFLARLIKPLVSGVTRQVGSSLFRGKVLRKFVPRAISQSSFSKTPSADTVNTHLRSGHYQTAMDTLQAHQQILNTTALVPLSIGLGSDKANAIGQLIQAFDAVLQQRLVSVSQVSNSFLSTIMEELRLNVQSEQLDVMSKLTHLEARVQWITEHLEKQRHQPELMYVYIMLVVSLVMALFTFVLFFWMRSSVINQIWKGQCNQVLTIRGKPRESILREVADSETDN